MKNDCSTDADEGWHVNDLAYNRGEISGLFNSTKVFALLFLN